MMLEIYQTYKKKKSLTVNFHFKSTSRLEQLGYVVLFSCVMFEPFFFF